ncbi:MAG: CDP-alcohol phosphatidyltransferase family protein [Pseudomonadota bacterium]
MKNSQAILYVPSDTPEAMMMATDKVAGIMIIVRGIMTLAQAGIERVILLVAETQREKIGHFLERYRDSQLPAIEMISYDEPYRVSPEIARRLADEADNRCLVINANLLFEKEMVSTIRAAPLANGGVITCREGVLPLPVIDVAQSVWRALEAFTEERPRSIESCLRRLVEAGSARFVEKPLAINTFLVKRRRDRAVAEKFLTEAIRHSAQGPVAKYINKRFSLPVSILLSKLWVGPNAITAVNIVIGLFSGVFVADGHRYDVILLGAILFQIASIADGCDGEVAKLTFRTSKFGQYIDSISDNLSLGSFMTGLIAGYWRHTHSHVAYLAGAIMLISTAITFFWMIRYLKRNTQSASFVTFDTEYLQKLSGQPRWLLILIKYGKYTLKKDVFSFAFLLFAVAGVLYWWLFITAFGTTVSAIILTYLSLTPEKHAAPAAKPLAARPDMQFAVQTNPEAETA